MKKAHLTKHRRGFGWWYTPILERDDPTHGIGLDFGILRVPPDSIEEDADPDCETHLVVLSGSGRIVLGAKEKERVYRVSRSDLFSKKPWTFHMPARCRFIVTTRHPQGIEFAVIKAENAAYFPPMAQSPQQIPCERRGEDLAGGTMEREVRAIFGDPKAPLKPLESNVVVGEVVNFPGNWSSYPPHWHPQPEVYYYRFDQPEGYGHGALGEKVYKVRAHDVLKITDCRGHEQVAAPGYAMWYLWFLRHLPEQRYEGDPPFTFFPEHEWVNDPKQQKRIFTPNA